MGAWGTAILSDDLARDVYDEYMDKYDEGIDHSAIYELLLKSFAEALYDADEGPVFWLALAKAQWECGVLQDDVFERVTRIIESNDGMARLEEEGQRMLKKRKQVLDSFLTIISTPKEKPRKRHRIVRYEAIFEPGVCLAVRLPDGDYGAAIVLAADNSHKTEGMNLIGLLHYKNSEKPRLEVFQSRKWLKNVHYGGRGELAIYWCQARLFKSAATLFEPIGTVHLTISDPKQTSVYTSWDTLTEYIMNQITWIFRKK